jgi:cell division transport system ATP-binding protein
MSENIVVDLKGVNIYQRKSLVLSDVNLTIGKSEFVYLIGRTGSGKSSLLKTLYGELKLTEGSALVNDFDLAKIKSSKIPYLRRSLGIVFQDFQLLTDRSVNENLFFVMKATGWKDKKKMKEKADEILSKVHMENKGYKMPHELSGGEQQRVAIARALVNDPKLILADEPTGNLDPETSEKIMGLLKEICSQGTAILLATHDYVLLDKFPSRTIKCENGKLIDSGH